MGNLKDDKSFSLKRINNRFLNLRFILGDKDSFNLENRIYISATLFVAVVSLVAIVWNISIGLPLILNVCVGIAAVVYGFLYYFSRFKSTYNSLVFIFTTLFLLSVLWMLNGGLMGSLPVLYVIFILVFVIISKPKYHLMTLIITLANFVILVILENLFYDELIVEYVNNEIKEADMIFGYLASLIVCYLLVCLLKKSYDKENKEILNQKKELQKLNSEKGLFFNILAHDLRSPFNSILGLTDLMTDKSHPSTLNELQDLAHRAKLSSEKAYKLLESLLEWGKLQQGNIHLNPQTVNLKSVIAECLMLFKEEYIRKEIEVHIQMLNELNVFADLYSVQTVIRNLISNAIKYTPRGGKISISIEENDEDHVVVVVEDTGIGMSEEIVDNLFRLDVNTNRNGTDGESSIGLGLIISKELAEKLGGDLLVESEVDRGSKFRFKVPKYL